MEEITVKRVYNANGGFELLEIWQGNNVIKIKFNNGLDTVTSWHWQGLQRIIDNHFKSLATEALK